MASGRSSVIGEANRAVIEVREVNRMVNAHPKQWSIGFFIRDAPEKFGIRNNDVRKGALK